MALEDRYVTATPEGVSLGVVLAGLGSRFAAYFLDLLIQVAAFIAFVITASLIVGDASSRTSSLVAGGGVALFALVDFVGYFVLCDLLFSGRSVGKRMAGLRVVRADGSPVGFWASLLRNVLRIVDFLPSFYIVGSIMILATRENQRLGDLIGGTVVVRERTAARQLLGHGGTWDSSSQWTGVGGYQGAPGSKWGSGSAFLPPECSHWDVSGVSEREVQLVRMFLTNRVGYSMDARARLAYQLASQIWPLVAGVPTNLPPERFLELLVLVKAGRE